jgi:hypothetical protein
MKHEHSDTVLRLSVCLATISTVQESVCTLIQSCYESSTSNSFEAHATDEDGVQGKIKGKDFSCYYTNKDERLSLYMFEVTRIINRLTQYGSH